MSPEQTDDDAGLWVVVLRPEGDLTPHPGRLVARLLKALLRSFGLRCVKVGGPELLAEQLQEQTAAPTRLPDGGEGRYDSSTAPTGAERRAT